jgi:hypothetical protein
VASNWYTINYGTVVANDITLTSIPEPQTWAMLLGGMGVLVGYMRRRNRK